MSLMLKLLAIIVTLSSFLGADASNIQVEDFLKKSFANNQNIKSINVRVKNKIDIKEYDGWNAYVVELDAILKKDNRQIVQKMVWFSNGTVVTKELFDLKSSKDLNDFISMPFKDEYYNKANLIYGNEKAKHKVVIFSDPLCPFCREFVPEALEYMKKEPNKFAVYYYHLPLESLHPASVELSKAAVALELQGAKETVLALYKVTIDPKEKKNEVILAEFNKVMNSKISVADLLSTEVIKHFKNDLKVSDELMVNGTPTIFIDGVLDKTKMKYKEVK